MSEKEKAMTQNSNIFAQFEKAAQEMAAQGIVAKEENAMPQFKEPQIPEPVTLTGEWAGRKLTRLNFEIGEIAQQADGKNFARTPYGGMFNWVSRVSVAGKPIAIDGIAGASVEMRLPDGTVVGIFDTVRTKEPLVVQNLVIPNRGAWGMIREASKNHGLRSPQLVIIGGWADYEKEVRKPIAKTDIVAWCFAFNVLQWGIVFEGDPLWTAPCQESVFLDGMFTVKPNRPASRPASERYGSAYAKAMMEKFNNPAGELIVSNPITAHLAETEAPKAAPTVTGVMYGMSEQAPMSADDETMY